jgi:RimJ/RimL family protein N-acetyltransferase
MMGDPEVMRFYPRPLDRAEASAWVARHRTSYTEHGYGAWLVELIATGEPIGQVGLVASEIDDTVLPNLLWMLHRPFWRRGYAIEAVRAVIRYALVALGLPHVYTVIRPENLPSLAVARKLDLAPIRELDYHGYKHLLYEVPSSSG